MNVTLGLKKLKAILNQQRDDIVFCIDTNNTTTNNNNNINNNNNNNHDFSARSRDCFSASQLRR